jgi:hypothetical protein
MIVKFNINSISRFFLDHNNFIKSKMKLIMKLNSQLTQYIRMKKNNLKKLNLLDLQTKLTSQTCE